MLITRSTPRITYKIGMRARLGTEEDWPLPWLGLEAPSIEVAADFTGIYRILMSSECFEAKTLTRVITKVPAKDAVGGRFGKETQRMGTFQDPQCSLLPLRIISS